MTDHRVRHMFAPSMVKPEVCWICGLRATALHVHMPAPAETTPPAPVRPLSPNVPLPPVELPTVPPPVDPERIAAADRILARAFGPVPTVATSYRFAHTTDRRSSERLDGAAATSWMDRVRSVLS